MPEGLLSPIHLLILFAILVLLFGAKRLPELGKGVGSGIREFRGSIASINEQPKNDLPSASADTLTAPSSDTPD